MKKVLGLAVLLGLAIACVSTSAVRIGTPASHPLTSWKNVAVYRTADQVPGKYDEVGLLVSTGESMMTNESQMWNSMRKSAAKLGANAIILDAMSEPKSAAKIASAVLGVGGAQRKGKAIAIYVYPPEK
jgi:hypothetical protein